MPHKLLFEWFECRTETDEVGDDEPWFAFVVVDWQRPQVKVSATRTPVFGDVARGDHRDHTHVVRDWGDIDDPSEMAVLAVEQTHGRLP